MVLDPQFLDWMWSTATVENFSTLSTDGYGTRALASSFSWKCRIEQRSQIVKSREGKETHSVATIYGPPYDSSTGLVTIAFTPTSKITLPVGVMIAGTSQPSIINVEEHRDDTSIFGYELYV